MINFGNLYSLQERNIIRLDRYGCLEYHHAETLAAKGYVKIFDVVFDFDRGIFSYPFGKAGERTMICVEFEPKGLDALSDLKTEDSARLQYYSGICSNPEVSNDYGNILFTIAHIEVGLDFGDRDKLYLNNSTARQNFMGLRESDSEKQDSEA